MIKKIDEIEETYHKILILSQNVSSLKLVGYWGTRKELENVLESSSGPGPLYGPWSRISWAYIVTDLC